MPVSGIGDANMKKNESATLISNQIVSNHFCDSLSMRSKAIVEYMLRKRSAKEDTIIATQRECKVMRRRAALRKA